MLGVHLKVPVACFRMGHAREYWESHPLPPPATCYGFLLSLVGETNRMRHVGCRVAAAVLGQSDVSVVLRTMWRVKNKDNPPGVGNNRTPGHQQLLTGVELVVWLDSSEETGESPRLEDRARGALDLQARAEIQRFGALSLGESSHLVDSVSLFSGSGEKARVFLLAERGRMTLPVWVDHVGSAGTRYVTGDFTACDLTAPPIERMPQIRPPD